MIFKGEIAQLVERWTENPCVGGSIPPLSTKHHVMLSRDFANHFKKEVRILYEVFER
jgi:hypothetical protein